MIDVPRPYRYHAGKHASCRRRNDLRQIVIDQKSEDLGRTVAIHLMGHNYGTAHLVVDRAEREWQLSQETPETLFDVTLEDLELSERTYEALANEPGTYTAGDLMGLRDGQLMEIDLLGPKGIRAIRERCAVWLTRIAENLAAQ